MTNKAERIRRTAKRTKRVDWKPVVEALETFTVDVKSGNAAIDVFAGWLVTRRNELATAWKASETQYEADITRGQMLFAEEAIEELPKLCSAARRAAK